MNIGQRDAYASREFLGKARQELAQGDLPQASEKGWGAVAQMLKAVAEQSGWPHNGHRLLYKVVDNLVTNSGDTQISSLFQVAGNLHINFYENIQSAEMIELALRDVQLLLDKLEPLLG